MWWWWWGGCGSGVFQKTFLVHDRSGVLRIGFLVGGRWYRQVWWRFCNAGGGSGNESGGVRIGGGVC